MRASTLFVLALGVFAASSVNADYAACTAAGQRCAGAEGMPYVPYAPCCDADHTCVKKDTYEAGEWGMYCVKTSQKCYNTGDRCMGAPNMPYVNYLPCCHDNDECVADSSMGWGSFCKSKTTTPTTVTYAPVTYAPATTKTTTAPSTTEHCEDPSNDYTVAPKPSLPPAQLGSYETSYNSYEPSTVHTTAPTQTTTECHEDPSNVYTTAPAYTAGHTVAPYTVPGYTAAPYTAAPYTAAPYTAAPYTAAPYTAATTTIVPGATIPVCAAPSGASLAVNAPGVFIVQGPVITDQAYDVMFTITQSACGETSLSASSLSTASAQQILAQVCAAATTAAGEAPAVCGMTGVSTGSIIITFYIRFNTRVIGRFARILQALNLLLRIFGVTGSFTLTPIATPAL